jgi:hypothetical protein
MDRSLCPSFATKAQAKGPSQVFVETDYDDSLEEPVDFGCYAQLTQITESVQPSGSLMIHTSVRWEAIGRPKAQIVAL